MIGANILAAFVLIYQPGLVSTLGFDPSAPTAQDAVTSLFLHANLVHLAANMLFLAAVGPSVELSTGSVRFVLVYFVGGLVGVAAFWAMSSRYGSPVLIGASGAVAAAAAYYSVRYSSLKVPLAPGYAVPVWSVTAAWVLLQIAGGWRGEGAVSYWAHVGGFTAGLALSLIYRAPSFQAVEERARLLREAGDRSTGAALAEARRRLTEAPRDPQALLASISAFRQLGDREEEAKSLVELLAADPHCDEPAVLARLVVLGAAHLVPSHRRVVCAEAVRDEDPELARLLLESVARGPVEDGQRPEAILALIALEHDRDPAQARAWMEILHREYALHPAADLARRRGWEP